MLLIVDNQSAYLKKYKRNYLAESGIDYLILDHNEPLVIPPEKTVQGIILSGGKGTPYEPLNLTTNFLALHRFDVPVLGLCLGFEIILVLYGGRIKKHETRQVKKEKVELIKPDDPIFSGIKDNQILLQEKHDFYASYLPDDMECLGKSEACDYEIIKHIDKPVYGFQSHPEVSGNVGEKIMQNFLKICGVLE